MSIMGQEAVAKKKGRATAEFRASTASLVIDQGLSVERVVADLGLKRSAVYSWVQHEKRARSLGKGGLTIDERTELARLRKEVKVLQEEKTILKKWVAFCAKENA